MDTRKGDRREYQSLWWFCKMYLLPGTIPVVCLISYHLVSQKTLPSILVFLAVELFISMPTFYLLMRSEEGERFNLWHVLRILREEEIIRWQVFIPYFSLSLIWAFSCFSMLTDLSNTIRNTAFSWVPRWFDLGDYITRSDIYSEPMTRSIWFLMILSSLLFPFIEEVYFRGYLMKRTHSLGLLSPIINTVLFAFYHLWSIWLVPARIVGIFPMILITWKLNSVRFSIAVHCAINLTGDVLLTYPLIFG